MSLGKLVFKLPEEDSDFRLAQNAWKYKNTLIEISNELRQHDKYWNDEDTMPKTWNELRAWFHKKLHDNECPDLYSED